jgi:hypothetical protein
MILGLTGQPFNGKDTAANYLVAVHGFHRLAFADPIRAGLKAMLGLTDDDFSPERKEIPSAWLGGKTPVELMESLGTAWGQDQICKDIWSWQVLREIQHKRREGLRNFVVSDVRFLHEANSLRTHGGKLLRIVRPGAPRSNRNEFRSFQEQMHLVSDVDVVAESVEELHEVLDDVLYQLGFFHAQRERSA